jgi:hypothetical protein
MKTIKTIPYGTSTLTICYNGSKTWFFTCEGKYDNGTTYSDAWGAYDTERKALNALKKHCKAANIEYTA